MSAAQYGSLPFGEAITFFRNKLNVPTERWADVWRDQHNLAFTVAGAAKTDLLADLRSMVDNAIANGQSLTSFQSEFKHLVKKHGWDHTGKAAWRANIIYSTNMRQSYNAGRYEQLQDFPYWEYRHGDSLSPRPHHRSKHALILPKDSSFWNVWFPQNGWGCKCKVIGRSEAYLKRKGLKPSREPVIDTREWIDKATGESHYVPVGIDPGFDYTPGKVNQAEKLKTQVAKQPPLAKRLPKRLVPSAYSTVKGANVNGLNKVLQSMSEKRPELLLVSEFVKNNDIKTLFLKQSELGRGNKSTIKQYQPIAEYLGVPLNEARYNFPITAYMAKRANGYTSKSWSHMVIKAKANVNFSLVKNTDELLNSAEAAILAANEGKSFWSVSSVVRNHADSGDHGGAIITWLHELGHQVHFKGLEKGIELKGLSTKLTRYSQEDVWEWHAEHFVLWALARPTLLNSHPDIAEYFDKLMERINE